MRRTVLIVAAALTCLVTAGSAYAADNTYTASFVTTGAAGSAAKPAPVGTLTQKLAADTTVAGNRAADPLTGINATISGLKVNTSSFPTCTLSQIEASANTGWNFKCPTGSLIAKGTVVGSLGSPDLTQGGTTCNLGLSVYNSGHGALAYFFTIASQTACGGLQTGAALPYGGTFKQSGKNLINNVPLPTDASTNAGNPSAADGSVGIFASLVKENLVWKSTYKVKGKLQPLFLSTGCTAGKRPSKVIFTSVVSSNPTAASGTAQTLAASSKAAVATQNKC
jgi:hypothetical protein